MGSGQTVTQQPSVDVQDVAATATGCRRDWTDSPWFLQPLLLLLSRRHVRGPLPTPRRAPNPQSPTPLFPAPCVPPHLSTSPCSSLSSSFW